MSRPGPPRLLLVAHGTRSEEGRREIGTLVHRLRACLPGVDVRLAWVDVLEPTPQQVLERLSAECPGAPVVVLPAFLAAGYHVRVDVPEAVAAAGALDGACDTVVTPHLGAAPEVLRALADRLAEVGVVPGVTCDAVVLGAAGSRDPVSRAESDALAAGLEAELGVEVSVAFASAAEPTPPEAVAALRAAGRSRVAVATGLLAPGFFADCIAAGAREGVPDARVAVSSPLGAHPRVVALLARRYAEACKQFDARIRA